MTLFADEGALEQMSERPFADTVIEVPGHGSFKMRSKSGTSFEEDYTFEMANYKLDTENPDSPPRAAHHRAGRKPSRKYSDVEA